MLPLRRRCRCRAWPAPHAASTLPPGVRPAPVPGPGLRRRVLSVLARACATGQPGARGAGPGWRPTGAAVARGGGGGAGPPGAQKGAASRQAAWRTGTHACMASFKAWRRQQRKGPPRWGAGCRASVEAANGMPCHCPVRNPDPSLQDLYRPFKLNIAAIGNIVSQLHVHVTGRLEVRRPACRQNLKGTYCALCCLFTGNCGRVVQLEGRDSASVGSEAAGPATPAAAPSACAAARFPCLGPQTLLPFACIPGPSPTSSKIA